MAAQQATSPAIYVQQPQVVITNPAGNQRFSSKQARFRKAVRNLGIAEIILGSFCILLGLISVGVFTNGPYFDLYSRAGLSVGEGIWGGIFIIIAGGFGVAAGKPNSSKCIVNSHMIFSIIGSIVAGSLMLASIAFTVVSSQFYKGTPGVVLNTFLMLFSLSSLIILIVSATYCCSITGCCKQKQILYGGHAGYTQQPIIVHGTHTTIDQTSQLNTIVQPGYAGQTYYLPNTQQSASSPMVTEMVTIHTVTPKVGTESNYHIKAWPQKTKEEISVTESEEIVNSPSEYQKLN